MSDYDTTVPRTILVIRGLDAARLSDEARAGLPRLPALEQWLARGDVHDLPGGWRHWLQRELAGSRLAQWPAASIAGVAVDGVPADRPLWLATPLHFVPGLDTVRVHPAGALPLTVAEQRTLQQDFAREFAGSGCSLHATGRRELLLALGPDYSAGDVTSDDPSFWFGADPREGLPRGPGAAKLRRLGAELEMWLHGHAVNDARAARGQLAVNALWIWGGGAPVTGLPDRHSSGQPAAGSVAWADDLFVDGLARSQGWRTHALPEAWPAQPATDRAPQVRLVVAGIGSAPDRSRLEGVDRDWIAPALAEWRQGASEVTLLAARNAVTLRRPSLQRAWRVLRRSRPWWQGLSP